jgi:hypothetical protein
VQNHAELGPGRGHYEFVKGESNILPKACDQKTLSMLWDKVSTVYHPEVNGIAKLGPQRIENQLKRSSLVVVEQILDVFQQERARPFNRYDFRSLEKQRSLREVRESARAAQRIVLTDARD